MARLIPLLAILLALHPAAGSADAVTEASSREPILATDLFKIRVVDSPVISPDGRHVAYTVKSVVQAAATARWCYQTQIWVAGLGDAASPPRALTHDGTNTAPAWSPDGTRIAFVHETEDGKPQIHLLPVDGGGSRPLTAMHAGATNPRWSPDGTRILFTSTLSASQIGALLEKRDLDPSPPWITERPGRRSSDAAAAIAARPDSRSAPTPDSIAGADGTENERRAWLAGHEAGGSPRVAVRENLLAEGEIGPELQVPQLYTIGVDAGAEPVPLAPGYAAYTAATWMPDGNSIVCLGPRSPEVRPDRQPLHSIAILDVSAGKPRVLLADPAQDYGAPVPAPDGKSIAFTVRIGGPFTFEQWKVGIVPASGGPPLLLTDTLDRSASGITWAADGNSVYFTAPSQGGVPIYRVPSSGGDVRQLTPGFDRGVLSFDVGARNIVEVVTSPSNPGEIWSADADGGNSRPLTSHNSDWLAGKALASMVPHDFVNKDGLRIDYWTIDPPVAGGEARHPLLVEIHGGPSEMAGPGEASMWHEFQYFAARGYVVVFANPRGSGGYGRDFQRANYCDWGAGPASDVLAAAGFAATASNVDPARQVISGESYGGYLTAWIIGHDHRFKAGAAKRGVYDLRTFLGEGNASHLLPLYFGGYPWEEKVAPILARESPITYVKAMQTPLLIQHVDADFWTGVVQSQMLYKSLKALDRPVEYVRYPGATHEVNRSGEPMQRLDSLVRCDEFFQRFLSPGDRR